MSYATEITSDKIVSDNPIHQRLLQAYYLAQPHIQGDLLEIGCGEGRGIELLEPLCETYLGIDKNHEILDALSLKYPNLKFSQAVIPPLKELPSDRFDVVVSFQVIEHIKNDQLYLEEIHRVLRSGGKALITTPNRKKSLTRNPWHVREYVNTELEQLVGSIFREVTLKGIAGSEKVMTYYRQNKESVERITRWDFLDLQHKLPAPFLRIPYDLLNRLNRNKLQHGDNALVSSITHDDYPLVDDTSECLDFFCVLEK